MVHQEMLNQVKVSNEKKGIFSFCSHAVCTTNVSESHFRSGLNVPSKNVNNQ